MKIETIKRVVDEEGFRPQIDSDGDVVFKYEGASYFIDVDENDEQFVRIAFPNFWKIESKEEHARAVECAHDATKTIKVAKIFVVGDNVWGTIELFVADDESFGPVFMRSLSALRGAAHAFADAMRSEMSAG